MKNCVLLVISIALIQLHILSALDIRVPPSIVTDSEETHIIYRDDNPIQLPCVASGVPEPEYEWLKNGALLPLSDNMQMSSADGTLDIMSANIFDQGYYQCRAFNKHGAALSKTTYIQRAVFVSSDRREDVSQHSAQVGEKLSIDCHRTARISVPRPSYTWAIALDKVDKNPTELSLGKRITTDAEGNLYFANIKESDHRSGKMYKCNAFNSYMDIQSGGSYSKVDVLPGTGSPERAPEVFTPIISPSTVVVLEGQDEAHLKCFFSGNPTPHVSWRRMDGINRGNPENYNTELVLKNVQKSDEGEYRCWGRNSLGTSEEVVIFVDVQETPIFKPEMGPMDHNATEGEAHTFVCDTSAEPEASVQWLRNGEVLDHNNPGPRIQISESHHSLTISNLCRDCPGGSRQSDLMVIQCNASNVHGYAFGAGYLNVLVATTITTPPTSIHIEEEMDQVVFECTGNTDPSTELSVRWTRNEHLLYPEHDSRLSIGDSTSLVINLANMTLEEISEEYGGEYHCVLDNGYSSAEATASLTTTNAREAVVLTGGIGDYWWIFLIVAAVLLLLILLIVCCICYRRNKGSTYLVDENERLMGRDPEKELKDTGFQDYQRPVETTPVFASRLSLGSNPVLNDSLNDSLEEYADIDPSKFNEDGSFIGNYSEERKRSEWKV